MKIETDALCPICLKTIPATKIKKGQDIFLERTCPEHGYFSDKIAKDAKRFLDKTFDVVGKEFNPVTTFLGNVVVIVVGVISIANTFVQA